MTDQEMKSEAFDQLRRAWFATFDWINQGADNDPTMTKAQFLERMTEVMIDGMDFGE